jgi:hypothetical protein
MCRASSVALIPPGGGDGEDTEDLDGFREIWQILDESFT